MSNNDTVWYRIMLVNYYEPSISSDFFIFNKRLMDPLTPMLIKVDL
jgi:hypothetical protein